MATLFPVGAGKTYSRPENALAALPAILLEDTYIQVYEDAGAERTYSYTSPLLIPAIDTNGFQLYIQGMVGSARNNDQIQFEFTQGGSSAGLDANPTGASFLGFNLDNIRIDALGANQIQAFRPWNLKYYSVTNCIIGSLYICISGRAGFKLANNLIFTRSGGTAETHCISNSSGDYCSMSNNVIFSEGKRALSQSRFYGRADNNLFYGGTEAVDEGGASFFVGSVACGGDYAWRDGIVNPHIAMARNSVFWSVNNPTVISATGDGSIDAIFPTNQQCQIIDPEFELTGDEFNFLTPKSTSPLLAKNSPVKMNLIFPNYLQPKDTGAYSDYTPISADDIIDTAGGNWVVSTLSESVVKLATLFGLTSEGSYAPDFPAITDVFKDIEYDDGNLTGTFAPYATTEQIGNLVLPTAEQIELGVPSDSNGGVLGTYDPTVTPDAPVLTAVHTGNGEFTVDFTTTLPTDIVQIQYAKTSIEDWTIDSQTHVGSGSITVTTGVENNGQEYIATAIVDNGGCISLSSNKGYVTPMDPNSLLNEIVRYRIEKQSDGEGGYIDILANPLVIYPTLRYDEVEPTATIHVEADIQAEDIISVFDENYYRVTNTRRNTNGLYKNLVLVKIERPVGAAPSQ